MYNGRNLFGAFLFFLLLFDASHPVQDKNIYGKAQVVTA